MRLNPVRMYAVALAFFLSHAFSLTAQKGVEKKYPTLLWEITGKGMDKPSYLFGTMHVSSKLVFHLSDSFYVDLRKADVVALELDPQLWQDQMYRFQKMQSNLRFYTQGNPEDFINEQSFQLDKYDDKLRTALSDEPTVINGLLYRTYQTQADFEEDTYLDLYIYQTGKKLGKQATGVENYFQTERLVMEAAQDMMKDKKKKVSASDDNDSPYELEKKSQEAYRKGDLDMLDSLEKLLQPSESYMEKFLYRRNEIQAESIDSIVKKHSLFVGVGAAHLPGPRGVIELLRKKGYHLRPIMMADRDATQKDDIDKIKVPVSFSSFTSDDGDFSVKLPGKLYRRYDGHSADSWQYADMGNGAYYMISRVKTHGAFRGQDEAAVIKKVDSLLYENIPGKILKRTPIVRNGYQGFDVTSKTRRGDIQRYNILVTPYEVLVFKMSGTNDYANGKEGDQFFGSITLNGVRSSDWKGFTPAQGGFNISMPGQPSQNKNSSGIDGVTRWEYESADSASGDAFLVWKKTFQNFGFLEEDTADLALMEESFQGSDLIDKTLSRRTGLYKGRPCLDATYLQKDGAFIKARYLIEGPHYYLVATHSRNKDKAFTNYFNSFDFVPFRYSHFHDYVDTFLNIGVTTPVVPDIDAGIRGIIERASSEEFLSSLPDYSGYWPRAKTALFQDDSTGEAIYLSSETFPKYFDSKDSATFWKDEIEEKKMAKDFVIHKKEAFYSATPGGTGASIESGVSGTGGTSVAGGSVRAGGASGSMGKGDAGGTSGAGGANVAGGVAGYKYILTDTNSSRQITSWYFLKDNRLFRVMSLGDTLGDNSEFVRRFYETVHPVDRQAGPSIFNRKLDTFFHDFYSKDSMTSKKARIAIPNVYFGAAGTPLLIKAIATLPYNEKDYLDVKSKLINELGYIDDSSATPQVVSGLKNIYDKAGDTSTFQNEVLKALAHHKTIEAYRLLKQLLVQEPPVFENSSDYSGLFENISDSFALARTLFPELLQLATVDDYKSEIVSLLSSLVDSGYLKGTDYESYFGQLYFDSKIQWRKQEGRDEKKLQKGDDNNDRISYYSSENTDSRLDDYCVLLMPFYDRNSTVPHFFDKLLQSRDAALRLSTAILLLRNKKPVADSVIKALAVSDEYRARLLKALEDIHRTDLFPASFHNQPDIARSLLVAENRGDNESFQSQFVDKQIIRYKSRKGYMYCFKYKTNKDDEWRIGFSGLQPLDPKGLSTDNEFVYLTGKKINAATPMHEQFDKQLKQFLISKRKSGAAFYKDHDYYDRNEDD